MDWGGECGFVGEKYSGKEHFGALRGEQLRRVENAEDVQHVAKMPHGFFANRANVKHVFADEVLTLDCGGSHGEVNRVHRCSPLRRTCGRHTSTIVSCSILRTPL